MSLIKNIEVEVSVELSGSEVADLWWYLEAGDQVDFFNRLGVLCTEWSLIMQLEYISSHKYPRLTSSARKVMEQIGTYAHHNEQN